MAKILIIDDSALQRKHISRILEQAGHEVWLARDGQDGVEQVIERQPDLITLDVNMPAMDGLTALSLIMQARPTPVIMVSSLTAKGARATLESLALGAVDFVPKPGGTISLNVAIIERLLLEKVEAALRSRPRAARTHVTGEPGVTGARRLRSQQQREALPRRSALGTPSAPSTTSSPHATAESSGHRREGLRLKASPPGLVIIGVSTGGPRTLEDILPPLPASFPWPVVIAQHMPPSFTSTLAGRLDQLSAIQVRECAAPVRLDPGTVTIARGGADMIISEREGCLWACPRPESPQFHWHPSVDLLVESAMRRLPPERLVGVLLTGMGNDGANSMAELKRRGGLTIAESEQSAVVFGMPQCLIDAGGASIIADSKQVAALMCSLFEAGADGGSPCH